MPDLSQAARVAVTQCLGARSGEKMLVITDEPLKDIGRALFDAGREAGCETILCEIIPRKNSGEPPPEPLPDFWKRFDLFLAPTSRSLTHTRARKEASEAGVRGATLPGITADTMARCLAADYDAIAERLTRDFWDATLHGDPAAAARLRRDATVAGRSSIVVKTAG